MYSFAFIESLSHIFQSNFINEDVEAKQKRWFIGNLCLSGLLCPWRTRRALQRSKEVLAVFWSRARSEFQKLCIRRHFGFLKQLEASFAENDFELLVFGFEKMRAIFVIGDETDKTYTIKFMRELLIVKKGVEEGIFRFLGLADGYMKIYRSTLKIQTVKNFSSWFLSRFTVHPVRQWLLEG